MDSHYRLMDMDRFIFAAIPGSIGFFYFIGSLALVFLGMFSLTIALVLFEIITFRLTANPILCSFYDFSLAVLISQFGVYPRNSILYVIFLFVLMIFILLLQFRMFRIRFTSKGYGNA